MPERSASIITSCAQETGVVFRAGRKCLHPADNILKTHTPTQLPAWLGCSEGFKPLFKDIKMELREVELDSCLSINLDFRKYKIKPTLLPVLQDHSMFFNTRNQWRNYLSAHKHDAVCTILIQNLSK